MSTAVMILACLLAVAVMVIMHLWTANKDLDRDLDFVAGQRDEWEKRARQAGWRFPLEQAAFDLQQTSDAINAAARALAASTELAKRNTEALKNLAKQAKGAVEQTRTAGETLDKAARRLGGQRPASESPPGQLNALAVGPIEPDCLTRLLLDAVGRIQSSGGQIEPDPKKRN